MAPREELADGGLLTLSDSKKARPGAEMRTPRWRAGRRHAPAMVRALRKVAPVGAPSPSSLEGEWKERRAYPGPDKEYGRWRSAIALSANGPVGR